VLSILIPVYEQDCRLLVEALDRQAEAADVEVEIIIADDHSPGPAPELALLDALPRVSYHYLPVNLGRAGCRNWLARQARYPYLLFIDGDMEVVREDFLSRYIEALAPGRVLCGGHIYAPAPPVQTSLQLHWAYGRQREQRSAPVRQKAAFDAFVPSNFVLPAALFRQIYFDESLKTYGHEDSLFGYRLKGRGVEVIHLDNPLLHRGLEPAERFIAKQREAVKNLRRLERTHRFFGTQLQRTARSLRLLAPFIRLLPEAFLCARLRRTQNLRWLDLCKLKWYFSTGS